MSNETYGGYSLGQLRQFAKVAADPAGLSVEGPNHKVAAYFAAASALPDLLDALEASEPNPAAAAIEYALYGPDDDRLEFLRYWFEGEFDVIRKEWADVPDAVFIGADPLHNKGE